MFSNSNNPLLNMTSTLGLPRAMTSLNYYTYFSTFHRYVLFLSMLP